MPDGDAGGTLAGIGLFDPGKSDGVVGDGDKQNAPAAWAMLDTAAQAAGDRYKADVIVVETAYPFTETNADTSPNLLGPDTLIRGYPATPEGQRDYLVDLTQTVVDGGGIGVIYWEPNWVSTRCGTRWGKGSNWENAAWFDYRRHEALPAFDFLRHRYRIDARATATPTAIPASATTP